MAQEQAWMVGVESVADWYASMSDKVGAPYYSVWMGKDLCFVYDGDDEAEGKEMLIENLAFPTSMKNSTIFRIKLYKQLSPGGVITDKTPYSASIKFRCVGAEDDALAYSKLSHESAYQKIGALQAEIEEMKKPRGIMGYLEPFLENPEVQTAVAGTVMGVIQGILGKFAPLLGAVPQQQMQGQPQAAMAGIQDPQPGELDQLDEDLRVMEQADPNILDHLHRLRELSEKNPQMFKLLTQQLEGIKP
jgi:hypothetical protein